MRTRCTGFSLANASLISDPIRNSPVGTRTNWMSTPGDPFAESTRVGCGVAGVSPLCTLAIGTPTRYQPSQTRHAPRCTPVRTRLGSRLELPLGGCDLRAALLLRQPLNLQALRFLCPAWFHEQIPKGHFARARMSCAFRFR